MAREFEVILHGATGFTGQIVAEHLQHRYGRTLRWAIAGRDAAKLDLVRSQIGAHDLPVIVADASDETALGAMAQRTEVVIAAAGPYTLYGRALLAACARSGTDYVDITGELNWIADMFKHEAAAKASGARIAFCCGFDSVPFDLGVHFTQAAARHSFATHAHRVRARLRRIERGIRGGVSGGSLASAMQIGAAVQAKPELMTMIGDPFAFTSPFRGPEQPDATKTYDDPLVGSWVAPFNGAFIDTKIVHRTNLLLGHPWGRDFRYDEMRMIDGPPGAPEPPRYYMVDGQLPKPGEGPSKAEREGGCYDILFIAETADARTLRTSVTSALDAGGGSTAAIVGESAVCLAREISRDAKCGGIWTSASLMGDQLIARLQANAQMTFSVES